LFVSVLLLASSVTTEADAAGLGVAFATAFGARTLAGGLMVTDVLALELPPAFCTVTVKFNVVTVLTLGAVKVAIADVVFANETCRASEGDCIQLKVRPANGVLSVASRLMLSPLVPLVGLATATAVGGLLGTG